MNNSNAIALLDANVIYSAPLRDFLLRLAKSNLYIPKWKDEILNEWLGNLIKNRPDLIVEKLDRTKANMNESFEDVKVTGYEDLITGLSLPDSNDRHVLAAAIKCGASLILTNNLKDFPKANLKAHNIEAISPDVFIQRLIDGHKQEVLAALDDLISSLKSPPRSKEQVLNSLEKCGLKKSVRLLR